MPRNKKMAEMRRNLKMLEREEAQPWEVRYRKANTQRKREMLKELIEFSLEDYIMQLQSNIRNECASMADLMLESGMSASAVREAIKTHAVKILDDHVELKMKQDHQYGIRQARTARLEQDKFLREYNQLRLYFENSEELCRYKLRDTKTEDLEALFQKSELALAREIPMFMTARRLERQIKKEEEEEADAEEEEEESELPYRKRQRRWH